MSDNKTSFLYTKFRGMIDFVAASTLFLFTFAKDKFFLLKNKVFPPKVISNDEGVHVDSDNLFLAASKLTKSDETVPLVDTDVNLDQE
jgi:hypothetical protein